MQEVYVNGYWNEMVSFTWNLKKYEQILFDVGISKEKVQKYGFAFDGKRF